jgi:Na+/H+ antiporter NhaD/arsenite permease-like protein
MTRKAPARPLAPLDIALVSSLGGDLFIVGSVANVNLLDQAAQLGARIGWRRHARVGGPVTLPGLAASRLALRQAGRRQGGPQTHPLDNIELCPIF